MRHAAYNIIALCVIATTLPCFGKARDKRTVPLREIHRASESTLQGLLRPIASRAEAKLVSPRGFQKVNPLIICLLAKTNSRGEFHEAPGCIPVDAEKDGGRLLKGFAASTCP